MTTSSPAFQIKDPDFEIQDRGLFVCKGNHLTPCTLGAVDRRFGGEIRCRDVSGGVRRKAQNIGDVL